MLNSKAIRLIISHVLAICGVCYILVISLILLLPHFPLAGKKNFKILLNTQMTLDKSQKFQSQGYGMLMLLGSSVIERGVSTITLDSMLQAQGIPLRSSNCAAMGMFARMNITTLKTMLATGIKPQMIVYGFYLDELNGLSKIHDNTVDSISSIVGLKPKTMPNLLLYGARSFSTLLDAGTFQMYIYMLNGAFRDDDQLNTFQKIFAGDRVGAAYTAFKLDSAYIQDLHNLIRLCQKNNIPIALCNTPIRSKIESIADFPYPHTAEAFQAVERIADSAGIPLWNANVNGIFANDDFFDVNHLNSHGARKFALLLGKYVNEWTKGTIRHDSIDSTQTYSCTLF